MKQLLEIGEVQKIKGKSFEVIHISAQGDEGDQHHFVYELSLQSEAEEKRQKEAEEAKRLAKEAADRLEAGQAQQADAEAEEKPLAE